MRSVRIERRDFNGPFPDPSIMQEANKKVYHQYQQKNNKKESEALHSSLQVALGGPSYFVSGSLSVSVVLDTVIISVRVMLKL